MKLNTIVNNFDNSVKNETNNTFEYFKKFTIGRHIKIFNFNTEFHSLQQIFDVPKLLDLGKLDDGKPQYIIFCLIEYVKDKRQFLTMMLFSEGYRYVSINHHLAPTKLGKKCYRSIIVYKHDPSILDHTELASKLPRIKSKYYTWSQKGYEIYKLDTVNNIFNIAVTHLPPGEDDIASRDAILRELMTDLNELKADNEKKHDKSTINIICGDLNYRFNKNNKKGTANNMNKYIREDSNQLIMPPTFTEWVDIKPTLPTKIKKVLNEKQKVIFDLVKDTHIIHPTCKFSGYKVDGNSLHLYKSYKRRGGLCDRVLIDSSSFPATSEIMYPTIGEFSKLLYIKNKKNKKKNETTRRKESKKLLLSNLETSDFLSSEEFSDHLPTLTSIYF